ncbi:MAG: hypothetical protein R2828_02445 [Saprospiraceae bacterium]
MQQLQDEQEWQYATLKGTKAAYQNYLQLHPNGLHANEARQRINTPPPVRPPTIWSSSRAAPLRWEMCLEMGE